MKTIITTVLVLNGLAGFAQSTELLSPVSVSSANSTAFFPLANLHQGAGVGFDANSPNNQLGGGGAGFTWVTNNPNGGGDYYANNVPAPILVIDLGSEHLLSSMSTWGYADSNTNGAKDFDLRFATAAEGPGGFGTSITYNPSFEAGFNYAPRDSNDFSQLVKAQYVEMTITDNWRGFQGGTAGGDRVGLGELAFTVVPEPSTFALAALGLLSLSFVGARAVDAHNVLINRGGWLVRT